MSGWDSMGSATERGGFRLVYQPIVHLDTGEIAGVEALCRFQDGRSVQRWFEECERLGTACDLDLAIIERALADLPALPDAYLAVNALSRPASVIVFVVVVRVAGRKPNRV